MFRRLAEREREKIRSDTGKEGGGGGGGGGGVVRVVREWDRHPATLTSREHRYDIVLDANPLARVPLASSLESCRAFNAGTEAASI